MVMFNQFKHAVELWFDKKTIDVWVQAKALPVYGLSEDRLAKSESFPPKSSCSIFRLRNSIQIGI